MAEIDVKKLEGELSRLEGLINTTNMLVDVTLIRSYVAEAALAHIIANQTIDFDKLEEILATEFQGGKREKRARAAVKDLARRVADPTVPQPDD